MSTANTQSSPVPEQVLDVLKTNSIGYLSVVSKKGELYSYPVAFHYSGDKVYFVTPIDRKSTRLNSSHANISYAVFCLKKKNKKQHKKLNIYYNNINNIDTYEYI